MCVSLGEAAVLGIAMAQAAVGKWSVGGGNAAVLEEVEAIVGTAGLFGGKRLHGGQYQSQAVGHVLVGCTC